MTFAFKDKSMTPFGAVVSTHRTGAIFSPDGRWVAYTMGSRGEQRTSVRAAVPGDRREGADFDERRDRPSSGVVLRRQGALLQSRPRQQAGRP